MGGQVPRGAMEQAVTVSRNENAAVSTGSGLAWAVGFFFAFRLFIMILSVWILGTDPQTGVAICLVLNFAMLGLVVFSGFGGGRRGEAPIMRMAPVPWALLFLGFSGCSLFCSGTASLAAAT